MNQNGKITPDESGHSRLKEMRIKHAKQQLELDRLEINLDKIKRYIVERDAEIAVEIRRTNPKMPFQELTNEVTNRLAKDDVFCRKAKYFERLRRRAVKLMYVQRLLSAEIEYLSEELKKVSNSGT